MPHAVHPASATPVAIYRTTVQFATLRLADHSIHSPETAMRTLINLSLIAAVLAAPLAWADDTSPVGLWKTIDDSSGKPTALIRITDNGGELQGKIEKLFREPGEELNPKCVACTDARKNH